MCLWLYKGRATNKIIGLSMTQMEPFNNYFEEDMRALTYQAFMG